MNPIEQLHVLSTLWKPLKLLVFVSGSCKGSTPELFTHTEPKRFVIMCHVTAPVMRGKQYHRAAHSRAVNLLSQHPLCGVVFTGYPKLLISALRISKANLSKHQIVPQFLLSTRIIMENKVVFFLAGSDLYGRMQKGTWQSQPADCFDHGSDNRWLFYEQVQFVHDITDKKMSVADFGSFWVDAAFSRWQFHVWTRRRWCKVTPIIWLYMHTPGTTELEFLLFPKALVVATI